MADFCFLSSCVRPYQRESDVGFYGGARVCSLIAWSSLSVTAWEDEKTLPEICFKIRYAGDSKHAEQQWTKSCSEKTRSYASHPEPARKYRLCDRARGICPQIAIKHGPLHAFVHSRMRRKLRPARPAPHGFPTRQPVPCPTRE